MSINAEEIEEKTIADLERLEKQTGERYELVDGHIISMAGSSFTHGLLMKSISNILTEKLKDDPCVAVPESINVDVKQSEKTNRFIPDASVVCPPFSDNEMVTENPTLLVEITSESTNWLDTTKKLENYLSIKGLKGYLIISQKTTKVDYYFKTEKGYSCNYYFYDDIVEIGDWIIISVKDLYEETIKLNKVEIRREL